MRRLLDEQTATDEEGMIVVKKSKEISASSLQSAYDEEATYRVKGETSQSGYVLSVSETCSKDNPAQLITDYSVEANNIADTEIAQARMGDIADTGCEDLYGDGGFYSLEVIRQAEDEGVEIHYTDMTGKEPEKGITAADFQIEEGENNACPNGKKPIRTVESKKGISAHFEKSACEGCAFKEKCPCKEQKKENVVRLQKNSLEAAQQRKRIKQDRRENTSYRAGIESANAALKRKGLRKLWVRGKAKCVVVCGLKVIAQNASRLIRYMRGGYDSSKYGNFFKPSLCPRG
jgi:hypothetical protein